MNFINRLLTQLLGKELDAKIKDYFISGAYKSILLQGGISLLTFCTALFIARITGDEGFGVYTIVFTWISIISVGATLGLDDLALKQLPIYQEQGASSKIKGLLYWMNGLGLVFGGLCAVILLVLAHGLTINGLSEHASYYTWAVWVIPLFVLMHVNQAALRGLGFLGWGQFAEKFVQPLAFFFCLVLIYWWQSFAMTDEEAIIARTLSFLITTGTALFLLLKYTQTYRATEQITYESAHWWKLCPYFAITSLLYIVNTRVDIIFLALYQIPDSQVGYYNAALKLSDIALIPFAVLYTVTAPMFSKLYASKKMNELQLFFTRTTRIACMVISLMLLVFVIGGEYLLALFGENFREGYPVLLVLCLTKFIHVFVGPVNYLLMMVDLEKEAMWALFVSVLVTIVLHNYWIPNYGIIGAAYATLAGLVIFEIIVSWIAYKKGGIAPTILGSFLSKKLNSSK